ncbi:MAG: amidohydrolase [Betaproteobacteria bacterium]|nr:amidohydrolase [Betaproteobacteria bacterium]
MATTTQASGSNDEILISADSHVMEPPTMLKERVAPAFRDRAPLLPQFKLGEGFQGHPGGSDPNHRLTEMETDGLRGEVLYPTNLLPHFGMDDASLQQACFRAYNDWLIEYCGASPERLIGIALISVYDIDVAVQELERCARAGLKGSIIWQAPHADLPFHSAHYNKFWAASQDLNMPVSLHILTGHGYHKKDGFYEVQGIEHYRASVNLKLKEISDAFFELIFYGVLDRYPGLKFVSVENEISWLPFMLQQWDYYYRRFRGINQPPISRDPSEYFAGQLFGTFFRDTVAGHDFEWWGQDNCMWSNDYPHQNSTWPESRKRIEQDLGRLSPETRRKLVCDNVAKLYKLDMRQLGRPQASTTAKAAVAA